MSDSLWLWPLLTVALVLFALLIALWTAGELETD